MTTDRCYFCGAPDPGDVHQEEDYPAVPCCEDEDECHARAQRIARADAYELIGYPLAAVCAQLYPERSEIG